MCLIDRTRALLALGVVLGAVGCAAGEPYSVAGTGGAAGTGTGGATGSGGAPTTGSGGATTTGSGGAPTTSSGGATGSGGATTSSGGATGSGGATSGSGGRPSTPARLPLPWMDDFEADTTGGMAAGWIKSPKDTTGVWAVAMDGGSKALQQSASAADQAMVIGGDVAWTDQKVEARVKIPTANSSMVIVLLSRFTDLEAYYYLQLNGEGQVKIRKRFGGSTSDLVTYKSNMPLVAGTWYTIGFGFKGSTVTAYLNGTMVGTMTESAASNAAGGIGLGVQNGAATFDDVKVTLP